MADAGKWIPKAYTNLANLQERYHDKTASTQEPADRLPQEGFSKSPESDLTTRAAITPQTINQTLPFKNAEATIPADPTRGAAHNGSRVEEQIQGRLARTPGDIEQTYYTLDTSHAGAATRVELPHLPGGSLAIPFQIAGGENRHQEQIQGRTTRVPGTSQGDSESGVDLPHLPGASLGIPFMIAGGENRHQEQIQGRTTRAPGTSQRDSASGVDLPHLPGASLGIPFLIAGGENRHQEQIQGRTTRAPGNFQANLAPTE